jgi:hypothetical protein
MPAAPARIPSILFAALEVPTSPTTNPNDLLPSPTTYGVSLLPAKPPNDLLPSLTTYGDSLPPAKPTPPAPNPSPPNQLASSHQTDPRGCLIDRVLGDSSHHLSTNPMTNQANSHLQSDLASLLEGQSDLASLPEVPSLSDSVVHVKCHPRIFGLHNDRRSTVRIKKLLSLINRGANICLTNNLNLLVDAINIQPLPITVALNNKVTLNDCCTKRGFTPLTLADGSIHWQVCYYCANAAEIIISPQAILASSNVFASWTMTGFKDGSPGFIRFDSYNGLLQMSLSLDCNDRLYYCPTNVFTTDKFPVRLHQCMLNNHPFDPEDDAHPDPLVPSVLRAHVNATNTPRCRQPCFVPAS